MGPSRLTVALFVVLLLVLGACASDAPELEELLEQGDDADDPDGADPASGDDEVAEEPAPDGDDPDGDSSAGDGVDERFAIPEEIDEAYVDLVVNELLAIDSETLRGILAREPSDEGLTDEDSVGIRAVAGGPWLIKTGEDYIRYAKQEEARAGFLPVDELGSMRWKTELIVQADDSCIVAIGWYDITEFAVEPYEANQYSAVSLEPLADGTPVVEIREINATPWRIRDVNLLRTDGEPIPAEDWEHINFEPTLAMTCVDGEGDEQ